MGLFKKSPEEIAAKEAKKQAEIARRQAEAFAASPAGRARAARTSGARTFQIDMPLSQTVGRTVALLSAEAHSTATADASKVLDSIEAEGWRLEHVGYVYRILGSVSRDKFMSSGQQEAMHGEIVGIYLFRATADFHG